MDQTHESDQQSLLWLLRTFAPGVIGTDMFFEIMRRLKLLSEIVKHPIVRVLLVIWALSGAWDLALSEWIPEEYSKHLPKAYQVVAMTTGLLSWQLWVLAGAAIIVVASFEYAYRRNGSEVEAGEAKEANTIKFPMILTIEWGIIFAGALIGSYFFQKGGQIHPVESDQIKQIAQHVPVLPKTVSQKVVESAPQSNNRDLFAHVTLLFDEDRRDYTVLEKSENITTVAIENTLPSQFSYSTVFGVSYSITIAFYGADTPLDIHIIANPQCRGGMLEFQSHITYNISARTLRYVEISAHSSIPLTCAAGSHKVNILFYTDTK